MNGGRRVEYESSAFKNMIYSLRLIPETTNHDTFADILNRLFQVKPTLLEIKRIFNSTLGKNVLFCHSL
jgi:hypothetical protein